MRMREDFGIELPESTVIALLFLMGILMHTSVHISVCTLKEAREIVHIEYLHYQTICMMKYRLRRRSPIYCTCTK